MAILEATAGGGIHFKPGTYTVTCTNIEEDQVESKFGTPDVLRFYFQVEGVFDERGEEVSIDAIAARKLSPKSKAWSWLEALGVPISVGAKIDTDSAIGLSCLAVIVDKASEDGALFSRVDKLIPLQAATKAAVPVEDMSISDWWAYTREIGIERSVLLNLSQKQFGQEPAGCTGEERAQLIRAATA